MKPLLNLSKGKLLGHPIHVMLVHFPMALFPFSFVLQLIAFLKQDTQLALFAFYSIAAGLLLAFLAALFGAIDLFRIPPASDAMKKGLLHAGINLSVVTGYAVIATLDFKNHPAIPVPSILKVSINAILILSMSAAAHWGGDLIYKYKVGIEDDKIPKDI